VGCSSYDVAKLVPYVTHPTRRSRASRTTTPHVPRVRGTAGVLAECARARLQAGGNPSTREPRRSSRGQSRGAGALQPRPLPRPARPQRRPSRRDRGTRRRAPQPGAGTCAQPGAAREARCSSTRRARQLPGVPRPVAGGLRACRRTCRTTPRRRSPAMAANRAAFRRRVAAPRLQRRAPRRQLLGRLPRPVLRQPGPAAARLGRRARQGRDGAAHDLRRAAPLAHRPQRRRVDPGAPGHRARVAQMLRGPARPVAAAAQQDGRRAARARAPRAGVTAASCNGLLAIAGAFTPNARELADAGQRDERQRPAPSGRTVRPRPGLPGAGARRHVRRGARRSSSA
jgi:hypothetical protein